MPTRALWLLLILLLAAAGARVYRLQAQSLWFDEAWSAYAAVQPNLQAAANADATNPPLYYVLLNATVRGIGDSPLALRWFSLLWGVLAVPLAYRLGRRLFNVGAGLGAAFLVAFNPLLWWAAQEARMYTLLAVLVLVAVLAWHQLHRRPTRGAWLTLLAIELALLYAHNTGPVVALWLNVVTLFAWLTHRLPPPHHRIERGSRNDVKLFSWFLGQVIVALLWSPYFFSRFLLLTTANSAVTAAPQVNLALLGQLWQALWAGSWLMVGQETTLSIFAAIAFILALSLIPYRNRAARWLLAHVVILSGSLVLGLSILGNELHSRYLVMIVPLMLTLIGAGLSNLWRSVGTTSMPPLASLSLRLAPPLLFLVIFLVGVHLAAQNPAYQHDDAHGMAQYYADHLTEQDTVLAWSYADRYDLWYYWDRQGVSANRLTLPEGGDLDAALPLLPSSGDVALNIWYTQRADFRGMMSCLLADGTINLPDTFTVYGMSSQIYRSPTLDLPALRSLDIAVSDLARLTAIGGLPTSTADRALCLPIGLRLERDAAVDLKAAVIVHNPLEWEIARDDAIFADAAQRATASLRPGETLSAYPLLRLPYGAPPGDYPILLRVYDEQAQPSGYDLSSAGAAARKDFLLGLWRVPPGADWRQVNRQTDLPISVNLPLGDGLTLLAHNQTSSVVHNGEPIRLTLLWQSADSLPDLTLADTAGNWQVSLPAPAPLAQSIRLDWRTVQVPPEAASGAAELRLPDGTPLLRYTVESLPARYDAPEFTEAVNVTLPGVGELVGFTLESVSFDHKQPVPVTLVWKAEQPSLASYTVFVQLLNTAGRVIAQSDSLPTSGSRPTTGWRPDEYIADVHQLRFNTEARPGPATLIVGMYDASTNTRVSVESGGDTIILKQDLEIR